MNIELIWKRRSRSDFWQSLTHTGTIPCTQMTGHPVESNWSTHGDRSSPLVCRSRRILPAHKTKAPCLPAKLTPPGPKVFCSGWNVYRVASGLRSPDILFSVCFVFNFRSPSSAHTRIAKFSLPSHRTTMFDRYPREESSQPSSHPDVRLADETRSAEFENASFFRKSSRPRNKSKPE